MCVLEYFFLFTLLISMKCIADMNKVICALYMKLALLDVYFFFLFTELSLAHAKCINRKYANDCIASITRRGRQDRARSLASMTNQGGDGDVSIYTMQL